MWRDDACNAMVQRSMEKRLESNLKLRQDAEREVASQPAEIRMDIETITCTDWAEIQKRFDDFAVREPYRWIFRGQRKACWELEPRLERSCHVNSLLATESQLYGDFRAKAHIYTNHLPAWDDQVSWLSAMQHHGIPTRLLDWTYSAYVALFIAFEEKGVDNDIESAVWAVNLKVLDEIARVTAAKLFGLPKATSFQEAEVFKIINRAFSKDQGQNGLVVSLLPNFQTSRISAQQGCFLYNCNASVKFRQSLEAMLKDQDCPVTCFKFPRGLREEILRRLMHYNIHPLSLFPDLDALGRFITLKSDLFPPVN